MRFVRHLAVFSLFFLTLVAPLHAQDASSGLLSPDTLGSVLPERFGAYVLDQVSIPPPFGDPPPSATHNRLYTSDEGAALFLGVTQFVPGRRAETEGLHWRSQVLTEGAEEITFDGRRAYVQDDPGTVIVFVGDAFIVRAWQASGEAVPVPVLREALAAVDLDAVEALLPTPPAAEAVAEVSEPHPDQRAETSVALAGVGDDEGCSFDDAFMKEVKETFGMGGDTLVPWVHALRPEQAETAAKDEGRLAFPKAGNPWLACITRNDLLWAPLGNPAHTFLLRVKQIEETPARVVFHTEGAGLNDLYVKGRIEAEAGGEG